MVGANQTLPRRIGGDWPCIGHTAVWSKCLNYGTPLTPSINPPFTHTTTLSASVIIVCCCVDVRIPRSKEEIEESYQKRILNKKYTKEMSNPFGPEPERSTPKPPRESICHLSHCDLLWWFYSLGLKSSVILFSCINHNSAFVFRRPGSFALF